MNIFIDTAAFLATLNANDHFHLPARKTWDEILSSDALLYSSNYITLETTALLQYRFGIEAVRLFESDIIPVLEIVWVDKSIHMQSMSALLVANRRNLSLVDCSSFEIMRQFGIGTAFTFDQHFREQGFSILPEEMDG
jgi:uncharacterized protein